MRAYYTKFLSVAATASPNRVTMAIGQRLRWLLANSRSRVVLAVDGAEAGGVDVGVDLGSGDVGMAE